MEVIYSSKFAREYKKLSDDIRDIAEKNEVIFRRDPFDPKLNTHKLKGNLSNFWSFSIGFRHRIIFEFSKDKLTVFFHSVGDHDIYRE